MKVRVVSEFRDKYTDELCMEGMELEVSEERFAEMESAGRYVEVVEEKPATKKGKNK